MTFHDLSLIGRFCYLLFIFAILCTCVCLVGFTNHKKSKLTSFMLVYSAIQTSLILILYMADARTHKNGFTVVPIVKWYAEHNLLISIVPLLFVLAVVFFTSYKENNYRKNMITYRSVREAVDYLTTGLCFSYDNGRVMLLNELMYNLCFKIVGRDLQNANLFWEILKNGEILEGNERLTSGERPVIKLSDNTVWIFQREKLNDFFQLTAVDTTELYSYGKELENSNKELKLLNKRLKKYGEDVDMLTRSRERLETKTKIHRQLGQTLMASRRYLTEKEIIEPPFEAWKQSIMLLSREAELKVDENPMDVLVRFVESSGINVNMNGEFPKEGYILDVFYQAAAEALTNAVKHADAKNIYVDLEETEDECKVSFRNDGKIPRTVVTEGGGLSSLRRKIETAGGTMTVHYKQEYVLTVTMKKKRDVKYD